MERMIVYILRIQITFTLLQPGKGFINQTMEFIKGYIIGWCTFNPKSGIDSDEASFDCEKGPDSADSLIPTTANGYWTSNNKPIPPNMKQYRIFLDGGSPSLQTERLNS